MSQSGKSRREQLCDKVEDAVDHLVDVPAVGGAVKALVHVVKHIDDGLWRTSGGDVGEADDVAKHDGSLLECFCTRAAVEN